MRLVVHPTFCKRDLSIKIYTEKVNNKTRNCRLFASHVINKVFRNFYILHKNILILYLTLDLISGYQNVLRRMTNHSSFTVLHDRADDETEQYNHPSVRYTLFSTFFIQRVSANHQFFRQYLPVSMNIMSVLTRMYKYHVSAYPYI